jgi:hypothetical protein
MDKVMASGAIDSGSTPDGDTIENNFNLLRYKYEV